SAEMVANSAEAAKAADWLEKEYPKDRRPESIRMLITILRQGAQMGSEDGWFGPCETRYTWDWLTKNQGLDAKANAIAADKFRGSKKLFDQLDRDGDGKIGPGDLDWSDRNPYVQQANFASRIFRRMDLSGDGRLTKDELEAFLKMVSHGKDHATAEDFRALLV